MSLSVYQYLEEVYNNTSLDEIEKFNKSFKVDLSKIAYSGFYWGDINLNSPIVVVSLNPKLDPKAKEEQQEENFKIWLEKCTKGFENYRDDKELHRIWHNLAKVFFSEEERKLGIKKLFVENVVNLDWCYYYSSEFPTIQNISNNKLYNDFNVNLKKLITDYLKPRAVFIRVVLV